MYYVDSVYSVLSVDSVHFYVFLDSVCFCVVLCVLIFFSGASFAVLGSELPETVMVAELH